MATADGKGCSAKATPSILRCCGAKNAHGAAAMPAKVCRSTRQSPAAPATTEAPTATRGGCPAVAAAKTGCTRGITTTATFCGGASAEKGGRSGRVPTTTPIARGATTPLAGATAAYESLRAVADGAIVQTPPC